MWHWLTHSPGNSEGMWGEIPLGTLRGMGGDGLESVMALTSVRGDGIWDSHDTVRGHKRRWHWFSHSKEGCEWDKGRWCWFPHSPGEQCCWVDTQWVRGHEVPTSHPAL